MEKQRTALIAGATGLVGGHCLNYLLNVNSGYSKVISIGRRKTGLKHIRLEEHIVNFDKLENDAARLNADDIYCCLGTTIKKAGTKDKFRLVDYKFTVNLALTCLAAGASRFFLVTAMGASKYSLIFYNKVKGDVEEEIKAMPYKSIHIFRPSLLLGERDESRLGEKIGKVLSEKLSFLFIGALKDYKAIEAKTVARAMLNAAKQNRSGIRIYSSGNIEKLAGKEL